MIFSQIILALVLVHFWAENLTFFTILIYLYQCGVGIKPIAQVITLFFKRNANFLDPFFLVTLGHWPGPRVMYILSNGSGSDLQKNLLRYSTWVSRNPNLFEYMSFWDHDKTAPNRLQSMQTWYFFQMMHFFWSRVYDIESMGIFLILQCSK